MILPVAVPTDLRSLTGCFLLEQGGTIAAVRYIAAMAGVCFPGCEILSWREFRLFFIVRCLPR